MSVLLEPATFEELCETVRSTPRLLAVGARTKPRLSAVDVMKVSTSKLRGISEYEPSEFTFTAAAGTPVREIVAALAEQGQYLPFDPMLTDAGATIGGTVAAGLSGPGRFRFGGVRDFILGVRFVDGAGRLLRMGGKVVKNAAGFDLPKFFVGSAGRFGVLAEVTFKVFPRPASARTFRLSAETCEAAERLLMDAARARFEFDALDVAPGQPGVVARLAGPAAALEGIAREVLTRWPGEVLPASDAEKLWTSLREFRWCHSTGPLLKVALSPKAVAALGKAVAALTGAAMHVSMGGNVAYLALSNEEQIAAFSTHLLTLGLCGLVLRGSATTGLWIGLQNRPAISQAVKQALDPLNRFPGMDE